LNIVKKSNKQMRDFVYNNNAICEIKVEKRFIKRIILIFVFLMCLYSFAGIKLYTVSSRDKNAVITNSVTVDIGEIRAGIFDVNMNRLTNDMYEYYAIFPPTENAVREVVAMHNTEAAVGELLNGRPVKIRVSSEFNPVHGTVHAVPLRYGNKTAEHIIGYVNKDGDGVSGVERAFNDFLKINGTKKLRFAGDPKGRVITGIKPEEIRHNYYENKGVVLTIDAKIQKIVENALFRNVEKGAAVVVDINAGQIKAMASVPVFNRDNLTESLNDNDGKPFINRALLPYNLGSVFKLCVAAAAIEDNITLDYYCTGNINIGVENFQCFGKTAHGKIGLSEAISQSCNVYFIELSKKVGADKILDMARSMGLSRETILCDGIINKKGSLPNLRKLQTQPASLANFSFGQGEIMTTPLQIASMTAAIANGGKFYKPSLISGTIDENNIFTKEKSAPPSFIMSEKTAKILCDYMINSVEMGTGIYARPQNGGAGGKTGTAETGWRDGERAITQSWFSGFYPADNPKYAITILREDGESGGRDCGPVFREIADAITRVRD